MKKIITALFIAFTVISCHDRHKLISDEKTEIMEHQLCIEEKIIDSCSYIIVNNRFHGGVAIIHKTNCKNHKR